MVWHCWDFLIPTVNYLLIDFVSQNVKIKIFRLKLAKPLNGYFIPISRHDAKVDGCRYILGYLRWPLTDPGIFYDLR